MRVGVPTMARDEELGVEREKVSIRIPSSDMAGQQERREGGVAGSFCHQRKLSKHIVPAGHGYAFVVEQGTRFRIVDLHGEQVVDLMAWVIAPSSSNITSTTTTNPRAIRPSLEVMSPAQTRYHLRGVTPTISECLYSNASRPLLRITADTVKVHDMTYMACSPSFYAEMHLPGHRSCAQNIFEAMQPYGLRHVLQVPEPFNCFQNTPNYSLKAMGSSKPGDFVEFEGLVREGLVVAVSCCPFDVGGFNGGRATDVAVVVSEEKGEGE